MNLLPGIPSLTTNFPPLSASTIIIDAFGLEISPFFPVGIKAFLIVHVLIARRRPDCMLAEVHRNLQVPR